MLLFNNDWRRFPTAIADFETKNESFIYMARLYKQMGIKNCLWPLALLQPELQGVDPHSEDLTMEQKLLIAAECKYNPWYYFREVVRIPPTAGPNPIPFKANRGNLAMIWLFFCSIDVALIQPRQTGKSVSTDTLMNLLIFIMLDNTTINLITKDDSLRRENIQRLKDIRDYLPSYLVNRSRGDADNQVEITCTALGNSYNTGVSQKSEKAANNLGRGMTVPINHIDEGPFIDHIGTTIPAALASGSSARDEAKLNGTPHGNIFTTTAGKKDDRDGRYMYDMIHGGAIWNEIFLDAPNKKILDDLIKTNCTGRKVMVNATFSHRQLGKTDEWLQQKITEANAEGEVADRDFFNRWTSGTQSSPLTTKQNETIRDSEIDPIYNEITRDNYILRWYIPEDEIDRYMSENHVVMGLDTSEAVGRDSIGLVMANIIDLSIVGASTVNETNLIRYAKFIATLMVKYSNTTLVIEKKSTGQMIVDLLILELLKYDIDPFKRIYNRIVDEANERFPEEFKVLQGPLSRRAEYFYDKHKKQFGFNTTGDSRNLLYSKVLQNAAKRGGGNVRDRVLSTEIRGLVMRKGRIDHEASGNDDMVIAWLLTEWFLTYSKNLSFYGIDVTKIRTHETLNKKTDDPREEYRQEKQARVIAEIEEIYEKLQNVSCEMTAMKLEHRLRKLDTEAIDEGDAAVAVDSIIREAKEKRNRQSRISSRQQASINTRQIWGR